jgi:polyferredoxin
MTDHASSGYRARNRERVIPPPRLVHLLNRTTGEDRRRLRRVPAAAPWHHLPAIATLIYALLYTPGIGLTGWEWFWVVVAGLFDIVQWAAGASQRSQFPGRRSTV